MVNEFKAEFINGDLVVKPIIEKNGKDIKVIIPSFQLMHKLKQDYNNGKRNL